MGYGNLETARNPSAVLKCKIDEMAANMFIGRPSAIPEIDKMQKMYKLDDAAARRLAEWMKGLTDDNRESSIELMHKHLETSNKASSRLMMITKGLKAGEPLPTPETRVAEGSYLDEQKKQQEAEKAEKEENSRRDKSR